MTADVPLNFLPAHVLARKLAAGETTSAALTQLCLDQIERHNLQGLGLRAVIAACPRGVALREARRLDGEREAGRVRGPLHGIPVVVKDALVTAEELGMPTTAGAAVFRGMRPRRSAPVVERMRDAGMIIIAKGNMTEFCGMKSKETPVGWCAVGGQSLSVFRREGLKEEDQPTAGGSSSGPAVSISAGFAPLAVGTETAGSTVYPATTAGLYGLKITPGSAPTAGVFCISESFDGLGPMARDPADLARLARAVMDPEAVPADGFGAALEAGFGGLGVGVVERTWGVGGQAGKEFWEEPDVVEAWDGALEKMRSLGARVVSPLDAPDADTLKHDGEDLMSISYHEFQGRVSKFLESYHPDPDVTCLKDIIAWNEKHPDESMPEPHRGQTELISAADNTMAPAKHDAVVPQLRRLAGPDGLGRAMRTHGLDVVVSASHSRLVSFAACAGWPIAGMPLARRAGTGVPYGVFAVAGAGREDVLVRFMAAWHGAFGGVEMPVVE